MNEKETRVREALRRVVNEGEPSVDRLVESLPTILAEAQRRRATAQTPSVQLALAGKIWLPRFAAVTLLVALLSVGWSISTENGTTMAATDETTTLDHWLVTGNLTDDGVEDPILDALVR